MWCWCMVEEEKAHGQIFVTGNTVIDALHMVVKRLKEDQALAEEQEKVLADAGYDVRRLDPSTSSGTARKLVLITGHRRENFGEGFISMVTAMKDLSEKYPDGIQEEAPGLGKPVLVMRDTTERPEALESGTVHLVGTNHDLIVSEVSTLLDDPEAYDKMSKAVNPYGDGKGCQRIVQALKGD